MSNPCPVCLCASDSPAHPIAGAIAIDDIDRAITLGLLEFGACLHCSDSCRGRLEQERDARLDALAARGRYLARQARLARRAAERAAQRGGGSVTDGSGASSTPAPAAGALPPAAAASLARALARATGKPR